MPTARLHDDHLRRRVATHLNAVLRHSDVHALAPFVSPGLPMRVARSSTVLVRVVRACHGNAAEDADEQTDYNGPKNELELAIHDALLVSIG